MLVLTNFFNLSFCWVSVTQLFLSSAEPPSYGTPGCVNQIDLNDDTGRILSGGRNRTYRIHLPINYDNKDPTPLILSYHGATENAHDQERQSGFSNPLVNPDMIAVYPQGVHFCILMGPSYADPNISDKLFTTDLLNHLKNNYCIDTRKIYANGKSNGGGFVGSLACSPAHGQEFAAYSAVVGAFYHQFPTDKCTPAHLPVPILEFHGTGDTVVNYHGSQTGNGGPLPPIPEWLGAWALRDKCPDPPQNSTQTLFGGNVDYVTYSCNGVQDIVQHYRIKGMGHTWPTVAKGDFIDASPLIMDFYRNHPKS